MQCPAKLLIYCIDIRIGYMAGRRITSLLSDYPIRATLFDGPSYNAAQTFRWHWTSILTAKKTVTSIKRAGPYDGLLLTDRRLGFPCEHKCNPTGKLVYRTTTTITTAAHCQWAIERLPKFNEQKGGQLPQLGRKGEGESERAKMGNLVRRKRQT